MVLVSSEWQNKSEDEQKSSTAVVATGTAGTTAPITTTSATGSSTPATTTAVAITSTISPPATATIVNADHINNPERVGSVVDCCIAAPIVTATNKDCLNSKSPAAPIIAQTAAATTTTIISPIVNDNKNVNNEQQQQDKDKNTNTITATTTIIEKEINIKCNNKQINDKSSEAEKAEEEEIKETSSNNKKNNTNNTTAITTNTATDANNLKNEDDFIDSILNYSTNNIKIMAENTKETAVKEDRESEIDIAIPAAATRGGDTSVVNINNNNTLINNSACLSLEAGNLKDDFNESMNSTTNSNSNTLQPSVTVKTQNIQNAKPTQPLLSSCPPSFTTQDFSSALQSALNATATNATTGPTTAAAGLQPNFLSQLSLTSANVAGLQKSNKQLNSSSTFATAAAGTALVDSLQTKNDSNLLDASNNSNTSLSAAIVISTTTPSANSDCNNGLAKIVLICEGNSHPFQARTISLTPNVECMVGRLIAKSKAAENNAIFDCKVLSRKHAVIWYTPDGKFWVKDTKSSNGTFINDNKLGDEEAELHFGDIVKFGVDVVENSRKEVHGCIIACVKLYLPDGREAISIDSPAHRSPYSGEGRISYDDLHRLNLYIQETAQREKVLASKLCSIQNFLDATRKNSALCWQSMITEDQLLHRIHSLEKKLAFMEKNVPENVLRNEVSSRSITINKIKGNIEFRKVIISWV